MRAGEKGGSWLNRTSILCWTNVCEKSFFHLFFFFFLIHCRFLILHLCNRDPVNHVRRTLPELLTRMAEKDMQEHLPRSVTGCNMLYLPNIGYVLAINKWDPTPPEDVTFPNLEFKFSINRVHYYKTPSAKGR